MMSAKEAKEKADNYDPVPDYLPIIKELVKGASSCGHYTTRVRVLPSECDKIKSYLEGLGYVCDFTHIQCDRYLIITWK